MPRGKRRHEEDSSLSMAKRNHLNTSSSSRRYRPDHSFSQRVCIKWFQQYIMTEDSETLGPEGMERFCQDIGVDPADVAMLVLAWKMTAKQMGYFTLHEWLRGLTDLQCDSKEKLHDKLDFLRSLLKDPLLFKSIFRYAFDFARDKDQRSMDIETSKAMLKLLLADQWSLFLYFIAFLDESKYRVINKDQWANILEFARTIQDDLTNYDVDGAWPVMLDEFVEWLKKMRERENSDTKVENDNNFKRYNS